MRFVLQSDERALVAPLHSAVLGEKWWFLLRKATYSTLRNKAFIAFLAFRIFEFYRECSLQFPSGRGEAVQDEIFSDTIKPFAAGRNDACHEFASFSFTRRKRSYNLQRVVLRDLE